MAPNVGVPLQVPPPSVKRSKSTQRSRLKESEPSRPRKSEQSGQSKRQKAGKSRHPGKMVVGGAWRKTRDLAVEVLNSFTRLGFIATLGLISEYFFCRLKKKLALGDCEFASSLLMIMEDSCDGDHGSATWISRGMDEKMLVQRRLVVA
ncbi:hypothetical protein V8G54_013679 [Vigna mungo]|uniref:Uncharacterized protein n=1 Tax=Vigna mungo TaxID=3915 RepID=A0AAQ3NFC1_VIGMU